MSFGVRRPASGVRVGDVDRRSLRTGETFRRMGRTWLIVPALLIAALLGRVEWSFAIGFAAGTIVGSWLGGVVVDAVERTWLGFLSYFLAVATYIVTLLLVGAVTWAFVDTLF